ncbi:hypothetical protein [Dyella lipolytica]|uniref:Uncharacterized protein n=1 Tax=Dyella lipolytica TaxID=1867835 RepID=A0ABW8IPY7_9GAMM|nr:hypothetical protein [Dyella lipolytica]
MANTARGELRGDIGIKGIAIHDDLGGKDGELRQIVKRLSNEGLARHEFSALNKD